VCDMANKVTRLPRSMRNQVEEPTEMAIFALGDMRVVINLEDGTVRSQELAEVISIEKKPKFRRARSTRKKTSA
jgi:hypothetical protein